MISQEIGAQRAVGVHSESGTLRAVIAHKPGNELCRLTNNNLNELLYDAIPNIDQTHKSHDIFMQHLRRAGVQVLYVKDLLIAALQSSPNARETLISGIIRNSVFNSHSDANVILQHLYSWLSKRKPEQLAEDVITGVSTTENELGISENAHVLLDLCGSTYEFVIPPLPNLLFTRDAFSIIENNVFIWRMAKPARQNEPLIFKIIFQYHPQLSSSGLRIIDWEATCSESERPTIEGGDICYYGNGILLVGSGERTNRDAIEAVSRTGTFRKVIAVSIPAQRDYMHLDTVLSTVGKHAFTLHRVLSNRMEVFTVETHDVNGDLLTQAIWRSANSSNMEISWK